MPNPYRQAARGSKKAMASLYQSHKHLIYYLCAHLLPGEADAQAAYTRTWQTLWQELPAADVLGEEQLRRLLLRIVLRTCRETTQQRDPRALQEQAPSAPHADGAQQPLTAAAAEDALRDLTTLERYIYLPRAVARMDPYECGRVLRCKRWLHDMRWESAKVCLYSAFLPDTTEEQIEAVLRDTAETCAIPQAAEDAALALIDTMGRDALTERLRSSFTMNRLFRTTVLVAGVCLAAVVLIFCLWYASLGSGDTEEPETASTAETAEAAAAETAESAGTATAESAETAETVSAQYADIEIEGYGTITIELDADAAPVTVANFVQLAESGFYDGLTFHRIIEGFMMQGGDPNGDGTGGSEETIVGEFSENGYDNALSHTRGAVSMARSSDYDSASSQFFIVQEDSTYLDGSYAVFGYVTEGMDIVDAICEAAEPTDDNGTIPADEQPVITSITIR